MRAKTELPDPPQRTFIEAARRAQIVEAAIETIAELGYARASFAQIAQRAGLSSTGLISYHFAGKEELIQQAVITIFSDIGQFMAQRVGANTAPAASLKAYIAGNIEFIRDHRSQMKSLLSIFLSGGLAYDATADTSVRSPLEEILRSGQGSGEFREFDVRVMAATIQRAIDGVPFLLEGEPDLDLDVYAQELVTLFDLATRRNR